MVARTRLTAKERAARSRLAQLLHHAFIERNLKPQVRAGRSQNYWAELIAAEFHVLFHRASKPP